MASAADANAANPAVCTSHPVAEPRDFPSELHARAGTQFWG